MGKLAFLPLKLRKINVSKFSVVTKQRLIGLYATSAFKEWKISALRPKSLSV